MVALCWQLEGMHFIFGDLYLNVWSQSSTVQFLVTYKEIGASCTRAGTSPTHLRFTNKSLFDVLRRGWKSYEYH